MKFDRVRAKWEARQCIRTGRPSPIFVTLLLLLLTSGVSFVIHCVLEDPFAQSLRYILGGYEPARAYAYAFGGSAAAVAIFVSILLSLYTTVLEFGYQGYTLRLAREEKGELSALFDGFSMAGKVIALKLLMLLLVFLWSLLFVLPGIVASYAYSQAVYCLLDDPDIGPLEALRRSRAMMKGEKLNFFVVQLSFFGWAAGASLAVGAVTALTEDLGMILAGALPTLAGILVSLWLTPYTSLVYAKFYNGLAGRGAAGPRVEF